MRVLSCLMLALLIVFGGCSGKKDSVAKSDDEKKSKSDQGQQREAPQPPRTPNDLDLSYVSGDFFAAFVIDVEKLLKSPALAIADLNELLDSAREEIAVDPRDARQLIVLVKDPTLGGGDEEPSLIARFHKPVDVQAVVNAEFRNPTERKTPQGETYYVENEQALDERLDESDANLGVRAEPFESEEECDDEPPVDEKGFADGFEDDQKRFDDEFDDNFEDDFAFDRPASAFYSPDPTTIIYAPEPTLLSMIAAKDGKGPLAEELRYADIAFEVVGVFVMTDGMREMLKDIPPQALEEMPPALRPALELPDKFKSATLTGNVADGSKITLSVAMVDAESATKLESVANEGINLGKAMVGLALLSGEVPPEASKAIQEAMNSLTVTKSGTRVAASLTIPAEANAALAAAVAEARAAAQRASLGNDMRMIVIGFQNYYDTHHCLPPTKGATELFDKQGKPHLSWRVHLLPFIEENDLYEQFHLAEPWDSEHNLKLLEKMPDYYAGNATKSGETTMMMIVGPGAAYEGKEGLTIADSNTLLFVCAGSDKSVPWTKPVDLPLNVEDPAAALGNIGDQFAAQFLDGAVYWFPRSLAVEDLRALITREGGEEVYPDEIANE